MAKRTVPTARADASKEGLASLAKMDFQPLLTQLEVRDAEAAHNETWGVKRRMMMISLTRSRADMLAAHAASGGGSAEMYIEMAGHILEYRDYLKVSVEMADASIARLLGIAAAIGDAAEVSHA